MDFPKHILQFNSFVQPLLNHFINRLPKRNNENYATALLDFSKVSYRFFPSLSLDKPVFDWHNIKIEFKVKADPDDKTAMRICEKTVFNDIFSLLNVGFYRGLAHNHIPRQCQNCNRFFLLTGGYNTKYCEGITSNTKGKTCRQVGAKITEMEKINSTPIGILYSKVYKKINARKMRGKISNVEYNRLVAEAIVLKEKALLGSEHGGIRIDQLEEAYREM